MAVSPGTPSTASPVLAVDGVSVRLGGRQILDEVTFSIAPGEFVGLIGSNGAGKTTLLRVILGLQPTTAGTVSVARRTARARRADWSATSRRRSSSTRTCRSGRGTWSASAWTGTASGIPLPSRHKRELVDQMLEAVDATRFASQRVGNLSGGEQQRVMIAHALVSKPRLLLLDEPLANLDIRSAQEIISLLAKICRQQQVSVLISAHEMNPLLPVMDRIVYMAGGRAASGTTDEVIREDVLSQLYGHHVDVLNVHGRVLVVAHAGEGFEILAGDEAAAESAHPDHAPSRSEP